MTRLLFLGLLVLACAPARAVDLSSTSSLGITNEGLYDNNRISGSKPDSSFLTEGRRYTDTLSLLYRTKPGDVQWEGALDSRFTDDPRVAAKHQNLQRFYVKGDGVLNSAVVGDFFGSFSEYTLGKGLKGAQYQFHAADGTQITALAGFDKGSWDDVWNHNPGETVDRQVYGVRVQHSLFGDGTLGVNGVYTSDARSAFNESGLIQTNKVIGADWSLPTWHKLSLSGESAYSYTNNDQGTTDFTTGQTLPYGNTQEGWAHIVRGRYSYGRFKTNDEFERVSPSYATTVGSASPDLVRVKTTNTLTISGPWKWIVLNYTYFHNNLSRDLGSPLAVTRMPETGLRYEAPDWRPDFSIEGKMRLRDVTNATPTTFSRKRTRSFIASAADRFGPLSMTVDYEYQHEDASDGTVSARHHILGIGSNALFNVGEWKLAEGLRWDLQRDRDNITVTTDQTATVKANAMVTSPWGADAGGTYGRSLVITALNPGNDRRSWTASLGYNILKQDAHRIELRYRMNDNRFQTAEQDYKETVWELALNDRF